MMENSHKYFENRACRYYPCHEGIDEINCLFCYCPMYNYRDCPGSPEYITKGSGVIKVCTGCTFPHRAANYEKIMDFLRDRSRQY